MATQKIETGLIADSAVTTAKLADNSVTAAKIAAGSLDDQVKGISSSADAVAITIDSSENVGIGGSTITDVNLLNLQGSGASKNIGIVFNDTNTSKIFSIQNGGSALKFFDYTASTERMRIDSSGAVGIGQVPETARFSGHDILQVGGRATLLGNDTVTATGQTVLLDNLYYDASGNFQHRGDSRGVAMQFYEGQVIFSNSNQTTGTPTVSERMRIDSSGNVGIGETSPGSQLQITSNAAGVNAILSVKNAQNNRESRVQLLDESNGGGLVLNYDNGGNAAYIKNNVNGALSIYLGGTGTANELDDYEEGSWTPQLSNGTSMGSNSATYTKIGNLVTVRFDLTNGSGSGTDRIYGLPFNTVGHGSFHITWNNIGNSDYIGGYSNSGDIQLIQSGTTSAWTLPTGYRILGFGIYYTSL